MSTPDLQGLMMENMVQAQALSLLSEIQDALLNKEDDINETLEKVLAKPENLYMLVWVLDDRKPNFALNWAKLNQLSKDLLSSMDTDLPEGLIPNLNEAKNKYKQLVLEIYALYKMENKQVLMNISRKMLEANKQKWRKEGDKSTKQNL